jgi:urea transporter
MNLPMLLTDRLRCLWYGFKAKISTLEAPFMVNKWLVLQRYYVFKRVLSRAWAGVFPAVIELVAAALRARARGLKRRAHPVKLVNHAA